MCRNPDVPYMGVTTFSQLFQNGGTDVVKLSTSVLPERSVVAVCAISVSEQTWKKLIDKELFFHFTGGTSVSLLYCFIDPLQAHLNLLLKLDMPVASSHNFQ